MKRTRLGTWGVLVGAIAVLSSGCNVVHLAHPPNLTDVPPSQGLVYGQLLHNKEGTEEVPKRYNGLRFGQLFPNGDVGQIYYFEANETKGVFSFLIPPGKYRVTDVVQQDKVLGYLVMVGYGERGAVFEAIGGQATYVGTVTLGVTEHIDDKSVLESLLWGSSNNRSLVTTIRDDYAKTTGELRNLHPGLKVEPEIGLATFAR